MATPTTADLRRLVNSSSITDNVLRDYLDQARAELDTYTEDKIVDDIPADVLSRAQLLVAAEMYHQDRAPNGVLNQQYDAGDGYASSTPIRISSDPLRPAYPVLRRYMPAAMVG